jgi:hypothetical protein
MKNAVSFFKQPTDSEISDMERKKAKEAGEREILNFAEELTDARKEEVK